MTPFYKQGMEQALRTLGFKVAAEAEEKGTPYPAKSQNINAERLAEIFQSMEDEPSKVYPENGRHDRWGKPVSWGHSVNLTGLDEGQPVAGIIVPANPRS